MNKLLTWARKQRYQLVMLTLTASHKKDTDLKSFLDSLKNAKRRMTVNRSFVNLRPRIVGSVVATEVTGGGFNGWHPHFHQVMLVKASTQAEAIALIEGLRAAWATSLGAEGLQGSKRAFDVQGASAAGSYITKFGAAEELTLGAQKQGRGGKTPFQLLSEYSDHGDYTAGELFKEYSAVFKGRRQLVWSPGLKKLVKIDELSDEEVAASAAKKLEQGADELIAHFESAQWKRVRHARSEILTAAELGGVEGVQCAVGAALEPVAPVAPASG